MISIKQINEKEIDLCYELDSNTIFSFGTPPFRAVNNSPSETASSPKPSEETRLLMKIELFALEAYIGNDSPG